MCDRVSYPGVVVLLVLCRGYQGMYKVLSIVGSGVNIKDLDLPLSYISLANQAIFV